MKLEKLHITLVTEISSITTADVPDTVVLVRGMTQKHVKSLTPAGRGCRGAITVKR